MGGGPVDLLSERINLPESWVIEEPGTWGQIFDTDLVDWGESEDDWWAAPVVKHPS